MKRILSMILMCLLITALPLGALAEGLSIDTDSAIDAPVAEDVIDVPMMDAAVEELPDLELAAPEDEADGDASEVMAEQHDIVIASQFPDVALQGWIAENYDYNDDGVLSLSERQISALNLSYAEEDGYKIKSLQGIEAFYLLQTLVCPEGLTTLTLSGMRFLETVECMDCSLGVLSVSDCPELFNLVCRNAGLSALQLSNLPKLAFLCCDENPDLKTLDLSGCKYLQKLITGLTSTKKDAQWLVKSYSSTYDYVGLICDKQVSLATGGVAVTGIKLNKSGTVSLIPGSTLKLKATLSPDSATSDLLWSSTDTLVAYVDNNGQVTASREGKAKITVTAINGISASVTIKVSEKPGKPEIPTVTMKKDTETDICTVTVSCPAVDGADGYEFQAKAKSWSAKKEVKASKKKPSVTFTVRKGEKTDYMVRAYRKISKKKTTYSSWATKKGFQMTSSDGVKKSVSSVLKTTSMVNSVSKDRLNYRVALIDYKYDAKKNRTTLTTRLTMYFDEGPMSWNGTMITAIDNLDEGDAPFRFVETGSKGYIAYSKWNKKLKAYKKRSLIVSVDDSIDNACVADFEGTLKGGITDRKCYATYVAKWVAKGEVKEFRVKGCVLVQTTQVNNSTSYSMSSSSGSVSLSVSTSQGTAKGKWASITCEM